jgi:hypothetical protein
MFEVEEVPQMPGKERRLAPKTSPMPMAEHKELVAWVQEQPTPKPDDEGAPAPEPSKEERKPRESGTRERTKGGEPQ